MNPFEGQTAPESTHGFFDSPQASINRKSDQRIISAKLLQPSAYRASLQPVNEDRALFRADMLADTEAKLTRRLSEPNKISRVSDQSRKPLFVSHLPFSSVHHHLKTHNFVSGILRVNRRNRSNAHVFSEHLNSDVYICGSRDRNRALEGDKVAIKLIQVEQIMLERHEKEEAKLARNQGQLIQRKPDEEDEKEIVFDEDFELVPKYCGTVVAILERVQNQMFSGSLALTRPSHKKPDEHQPPPRILWFKATDKRVPLIAIPVEQAPVGFMENPSSFEHSLFLASIRRWPITSLHPFGALEKELGDVNDVEIQLEAIFLDHTIPTEPLDDVDLQPLPQDRLDLSHLACFTLPDQQNALSIEHLQNSYKVALHVSDLSAYVQLGSAIDRDARDRMFYVDGALRQLSPWPDNLRTLLEFSPNKKKPAFSVVWSMSETGEILETWVGKTVIRSCMLLTEQTLEETLSLNDVDERQANIMAIHCLAHVFHAKRNLMKAPALTFQFDRTTPIKLRRTQHKAIFKEFQLLANTHVAQIIAKHFPEQALLISQPGYNEQKMQALVRYLKPFGYKINPSALASSISAIPHQEAQNVIRALVLKCLSSECYLSSQADISRFFHHGLNQPLYTHFSSPLTRYPDFMVHHQLQRAILDDRSEFPVDIESLASAANFKRYAVDQVQENAHQLFLAYYLEQQPTTCDAIVVGVQQRSIDVMVLPFQLERRIHTLHLPLTFTHFESDALHLFWQDCDSKTVSCKRKSLCEKINRDPAISPAKQLQIVRPFDILKVSVMAHPVRNLIRVLALNPFLK